MTVGLILAVLALIVSAIVWAYGSNSSNPHLAGRGKLGVLISCGAAVVCGAAVTLVNFFWNVGQSVCPCLSSCAFGRAVVVMGVCDIPVISSVCDVAGEAAASLISAPFDWLAEALGGAAGWLIETMWSVFASTTLVHLTGDGYTSVYYLEYGIAVFEIGRAHV